jgi:hypothetical protein
MPKRDIKKFLHPDSEELLRRLRGHTTAKFERLNRAVASLIDEYSLVSFLPLDLSDEDSLEIVLLQVDRAIQFGEDAEVEIPRDPDDDGDLDGGGGGGDLDGDDNAGGDDGAGRAYRHL